MLESGKIRAVRAFVTASPPRRPDADLYRRNAAVLSRSAERWLYPRDMAVFWHAATRRLASSSAAVAADGSQAASTPAARGQ
jgi:hypothetical protein